MSTDCAVRVLLFVLGVLSYVVTGVGLANHASEHKQPEQRPGEALPFNEKRVDPSADPSIETRDVERIVESSGRVRVSPDHVTRSPQ